MNTTPAHTRPHTHILTDRVREREREKTSMRPRERERETSMNESGLSSFADGDMTSIKQNYLGQ